MEKPQTEPNSPPIEEEEQKIEAFLDSVDKGDITFVTEDEKPESQPPQTPEEPPAQAQPPAGKSFTLVHNGVEHVVDEGKMRELAQKGFDYDVKVGPHGRLVKLIEEDGQAQALLNNYFSRKLGWNPPAPQGPSAPTMPYPPAAASPPPPAELDLSKLELKRVRDYDNEADWLRDNLKIILGAAGQQFQSRPPQAPQAPQAAPNPSVMVYNYDPQYANIILPLIDKYADDHLSAAEYKQATSSLPNFFAYYDRVKQAYLSGEFKPDTPANNPAVVQNQGVTTPPVSTPKRFNLKPGGTPAPKSSGGKKVVNVWDLPNQEFNALVHRAINRPQS